MGIFSRNYFPLQQTMYETDGKAIKWIIREKRKENNQNNSRLKESQQER
jgi:hypothetical protein